MAYFIEGLLSATSSPDAFEKQKIKEKKFNNRVTLMENLERNRPINLRPKSEPTSDYDPFLSSKRDPQKKKKKRQYRRCLDPDFPEDELIIRGLYKLDEQQAKIYEEFVHMLSQFDHFDAV